MKITLRPDMNDVPPFYRGYVEHVKDFDLVESLLISGNSTVEIVSSINEEKGAYRYAPEKWTIKELLCHLMDVERIMAYRALRMARNDKTPLAGFEENDYAPEANAHERKVSEILKEMEHLRITTIDLFSSFTPTMLQRRGVANHVEFSVLNLGYIIAGHESHHRKILKERYLNII